MKFVIAAVSGIVAITLLLMVTGKGSVITSNNQVKVMSTTVSTGNFDSALWKAQYKKYQRDNPRIGMVPDLEREVLHKRMSREVVREILGRPEQVRENADLYDLGVSPFGVDYEQYVIEYDQENKVVNFFISRG